MLVDSCILCKVMPMSQSPPPLEAQCWERPLSPPSPALSLCVQANLGPEMWGGSPRALSQAMADVGSKPRSMACATLPLRSWADSSRSWFPFLPTAVLRHLEAYSS